MKEYKCLKICNTGERTEDMLNEWAKYGWKLVCSYAFCTNWLILEREKKRK